MTETGAHRLHVGQVLPPRELTTVDGRSVLMPDPGGLTHLQFRRYAGCPICSLHLRQVAARIGDVTEHGIAEVVVFHSTREALLRYEADRLPFPVVPDPERRLYAEFGLESSPRALLDPRAWLAFGASVATSRSLAGSRGAGEAHLGLPGDFLIGPDGAILACHYGQHAADQWSVAELLAHASAA